MNDSAIKVSLVVLAIVASVAACYLASVVLIPILLAFFLFLLLDPIIDRIDNFRIHRKVSAPLLILLSVGAVSVLGWGGYTATAKIAREVPQYSTKIRTMIRSFQGKAKELQQGTQTWVPKTSSPQDVQKVEVVESAGSGWSQYLLKGLDSIVAIVADAFLIPILALFLLLEKPYLRAVYGRAVSPGFPIDSVGKEFKEMLRGFFLGNLLVGAGAGIGFYILFTIIGLENRLPLAIFAGFINLIPLLGAVLGAVFPMTQALFQFDTAGPVLTILVVSITLHFVIANLIIPKVIGSRINVNATAATVGLVFWGWAWGGLGLLLAVPLMAIIRIIAAAHPSTRGWADLIAESPSGSISRLQLPQRMKKF